MHLRICASRAPACRRNDLYTTNPTYTEEAQMIKEIIAVPGEAPAKHTSRIVRFGNLVFIGGTAGRNFVT